MNDLCADIGYKSISHFGEQLCGDHVDVVEQDDGSSVIVLADGLGSGVKASILSTLTSKIISTMLAAGLPLEECVETIAATLPICHERGVAYSTFTIIHLMNNESAELIQYDNPHIIFIRDLAVTDYPKTEMTIGGKRIFKTVLKLRENDVFVAMSDGCPHAGLGRVYNFGWKREDIAEFMEAAAAGGYTAKNLATMLIDECSRLYGGEPGDDATSCVVKIRKREPMNILFGPPANKDDCSRMMSLFFSKEGKHIICGGTTSSIAAKWLGTTVTASLDFTRSDVPPIAYIDGVDLVTEGVITVNKVLEYANDYLGENRFYEEWNYQRDGASLISRLLFEEATDINFYVGRAVNPAHQNPELPINFSIKMNLVEELSKCLKNMGKRIKVSYF
ncbi:Stage II sporulation protein E (SpoIIE) [Ruminococcus sp. YE71]|uniref:SpoIIE family protein phosphatase n=1 Tax=unclassified Ruminococcus TaxID=2608920 RepID=UPI00088192B2|nr:MULTISPECIES: SpoIIE family protein phosphatase [unclassified Ruminococcus]SDA22742.1 Stage II sporulation protein E (SpoIIE) [Ruminococcus sp. YE78]SFW38713.1 Stage II sporulation protein E (SpoIIE) [Ruminococcus sp. YE71]